MGFCSLVRQSNGIITLKISSTDGHQHLTDEAIKELVDSLKNVRESRDLKGLVTTATVPSGSFCDGIDHDRQSEEQAARLAQSMAEVVRLLLELPVPTVAAVRGDATSLGLALALAHDHCVVWEDAVLGLPEARLGRRLPEYAAALLREKLAYSRLRKLLILKSQTCTGRELAKPWYSAHLASSRKLKLLNDAYDLLQGLKVGDGTAYAIARQKMYPEACAAVGLVIPPPRPRPSPEDLRSNDVDRQEEESTGRTWPQDNIFKLG